MTVLPEALVLAVVVLLLALCWVGFPEGEGSTSNIAAELLLLLLLILLLFILFFLTLPVGKGNSARGALCLLCSLMEPTPYRGLIVVVVVGGGGGGGKKGGSCCRGCSR